MKKRILSIVMAICLLLSCAPITAFAENGKHTVTVNAGEGGQVSTDGTSWSNSVAVIVNDGETLDGKVQYKTDEGYTFDGVVPKIVSVAAGNYHTVLLDSKGNVWTAGWNNCGQLGREINSDIDSTFKQVTVGNGVKIKAIAAGGSHTVLLDEDGNVWTAGYNSYGQLGITGDNTSTFKQVTVSNGVKIKAIAAGGAHTVLLDEDGNVWTAGNNNYGQLGIAEGNTSTFTQVKNGISGVKITAIAAGEQHTVLLDANGNVWTAGSNYYGQLGRDENKGAFISNSTFKQVTDGIGIIVIAAKGWHTVLLDANGNVWTAGQNRNGQLGRAANDSPNTTFTQVTDGISGVKITAIAAAGWHTVLLDAKGNVWTAGDNYFGQLGRDGNTSTFTQVTVGNGVKIKAIAASGSHTVLLDANGNVWTAGWNEYGQLGRDENAGTNSANPTFKQAAVNPNAITFEELLNTPIYNNSVFLVKFNDIQGPVITGLENGKTYCDAVEFTVADNDGVASVKAGDNKLTAGTNGKYTLEKGAGTVTVVATDKAKNETTITVTVNDGHTYSEWQSNGNGTHKRYCTVTGCNSYEDGYCEGGQASYFNKAVCKTCNTEYGELLTDSTAPTGEISIGTNKWNSFLNTITFGLFFKNTQSVTVTATDDSYTHTGYTDDKAVKVEYYLYSGDTALTKADLASKTFTAYSCTFNINPDNKYVIYTRLTDHAGNVTYISSNGIVLDATVPVISGIENGKVYCEAQTVTVTEEYIESVKVNGTAVTLDANNQFTLNPAEGTQTIVVTDKAGNETSVTVTVNDGHTYEWQSENSQYWKKCMYCGYETAKKDIPTFTIDAPDTVCRTQDCEASVTLPDGITDAVLTFEFIGLGGGLDMTVEDGKLYGDVTANGYPDIENSFNLVVYATTPDGFPFTVSKTVQIQNEHAGGVATCIELAICDTCGEPYGALDSTNHNLEKISAKGATVTEFGNTEYWHCLDCDKYFADENGENEIELSDTVTAKLPPEIIDGNGQSVTKGSNQPLTFRSNALFGDFIRFELDGETVDPMNYVVKEGSTIVTLNADYVATLSPGEHTIGIVSQSGTATATFTVNATQTDKTTKSPETGNDINTAMLLTLILSCGGVIVITISLAKRKRYSAR